jgi:hypothetical protein
MDKKKKINVQDDAETMQQQGRGTIHSDILGSYTGTAENYEVPEQDADDL